MGKTLGVLVEARPATRPGFVTGTACRFVDTEFPGTRDDIGRLVLVRLVDGSAEFPVGVRVLPGEEHAGASPSPVSCGGEAFVKTGW